MEALTRRLEVDPAFIMSAYEDTFYYLWRERRLPVNVDALDSKIKDPIERNRLARIFEQDLGNVIGYVVPLRRIPTRSGMPRWTSQPWFTASKQLFLVPGDSPLGYRLPLESLPWTKRQAVAQWRIARDQEQCCDAVNHGWLVHRGVPDLVVMRRKGRT